MEPLRIGTLGAARITPAALIKPAGRIPEVEVVAVAARDRARAEQFARKHTIPTVHSSYDALIADPDVDAIYNPLPNGLHGRWTIAALRAGKPVLCEKPLTANTEEAEQVAAVARDTGLVVLEAFHYRYHPLVDRLLEIIRGELGPLRRVETRMCIPLPMRKDIRYQLDLAGGAVMDVGCYAIHQARTLAGAEPEVVSARAKCASPGVDRWLRADLQFPDGCAGSFECALWSRRLLSLGARVEGEHGTLTVFNLTGPQYFHRVVVTTRDSATGAETKRRERVKGEHTYWYQLRAFVAAVRDGAPYPTNPTDSVANLRVMDASYRAAGLEPRQPT
ncbi:MAG TPA: Gfo/Idh/MocA family oxidoreductase [Acidimicrobiia bacterium]|nr:Gfo/Idh/MocA family oxidoreductase [Acidimicrobiia bacterium]